MENTKVLKTTEEIKAISDPYRFKIITTFAYFNDGATATQIAEKLGEVPSKVYYHIKKLEKAGIVSVVGTEIINGIVAKYYKPTAESFTIEAEEENFPNPFFKSETEKMLRSVYNESLSKLSEVIEGKSASGDPMVASANEIYVTPEELEELKKIFSKLKSKKEKREGAKRTHMLLTIVQFNEDKE